MGATAGILMAVGGGVQAYGALEEGNAKNAAYSMQAGIDRRSAQIALDQGEADVTTLRKNIYKTVGAQRAAAGASGLAASDIMDVLANTNTEGELDIQRRRYNASLQAQGFMDQATLDQFYGKQAKKAGQLSAAATIFGTGGKIATL